MSYESESILPVEICNNLVTLDMTSSNLASDYFFVSSSVTLIWSPLLKWALSYVETILEVVTHVQAKVEETVNLMLTCSAYCFAAS